MSEWNDEKLDRLFENARSQKMDTTEQELYFETRILARVRELNARSSWLLMAWRAIPAFVVLTAIIAIISATVSFNASKSGDLFAAITVGQEERLARNYLAGE